MIHFASRWSFPLIVTVFLSQLLFVQFASADKPIPVIVAETKVSKMTDRIEAIGTLRARESVTITATVTDKITRINFDDGQRVNTGDILVEMTSAEEHAVLEEEISTFEEVKKQLNRILQLIESEAVPQTLLDQQRREYETAQARLRQVESRLQDRLIIAPFPGVVGLRNISVGALVEPGDVITTLDDDSAMKLDFPVPETFLGSLEIGLAINAQAASFGGRSFSGVISSIDSRVDAATRSITARALLKNSDRSLKPGMLMRVELLQNPRKSIIIPEEAIIPIGNSTFVYRIIKTDNQDTVEKTSVQIGGRRAGEVEIIEGLTSGDLVVVHGGMRLRPGAAVSIRAVDDGSTPIGQLLKEHLRGEKSK